MQAAQIHYLRGSLYFPIGNISGCLAEQKLPRARRASGSRKLQLRTLSGQADAHYANSHIVSSYEHFRGCRDEPQTPHGTDRGSQSADGRVLGAAMGNLDDVDETAQAALRVTADGKSSRRDRGASRLHHEHLERGEVELAAHARRPSTWRERLVHVASNPKA
jgi:hypothetical protein